MAGPGDGDAELLLSHTVIHYSTPHRKKKAPRHIKAAKMLDAPRRRYYNKRAGFVPAYTPRCCAVGSARGLGPRGRRFESCHLDQNKSRRFVRVYGFFFCKYTLAYFLCKSCTKSLYTSGFASFSSSIVPASG